MHDPSTATSRRDFELDLASANLEHDLESAQLYLSLLYGAYMGRADGGVAPWGDGTP